MFAQSVQRPKPCKKLRVRQCDIFFPQLRPIQRNRQRRQLGYAGAPSGIRLHTGKPVVPLRVPMRRKYIIHLCRIARPCLRQSAGVLLQLERNILAVLRHQLRHSRFVIRLIGFDTIDHKKFRLLLHFAENIAQNDLTIGTVLPAIKLQPNGIPAFVKRLRHTERKSNARHIQDADFLYAVSFCQQLPTQDGKRNHLPHSFGLN